ncbi:Dipeptidyl peptidase 4 like protein [Verticillium longisporum]|nr:Dipeptidyl peptidase 4 like protein [Verticillium longisporum]
MNTAALVDLLVGNAVPHAKFNWHAFTDSDHSIVYNGAGAFIYKVLTEALYAEKNRKGDPLKHQWSRKSVANAKFVYEY